PSSRGDRCGPLTMGAMQILEEISVPARCLLERLGKNRELKTIFFAKFSAVKNKVTGSGRCRLLSAKTLLGGHYSPVNTNEDDHSQPQPPAYTPSTAPSSPYIHAHQAPSVAGSSAAGPSSGLYPQLDYNAPPPSGQYQPTYQHPKFIDPSKPPLPHQQFQHQHPHPPPQASCMASPLILMNPPSRIEDLKAKPGVVVCQHCSYLILTETTPENGSCTYLGILGLLLAGVTSCGCCLLPLCVTSFKDIMHSCPSCHEDIGLYSRIKEKTFPVARE
ncbi:hypothetical protein BGZ83_003374, partial [Gryganskiella cystojenkinii]